MPEFIQVFGSPSERIFLHFDVPQHHIKLETFIATANSTKRIIDKLNSEFFEDNLTFELIVEPPKNGSFLSLLKIRFKGTAIAGGVTFAFLNSPVGAAFIEGLTDKTPVEWARLLGEATSRTAADVTDQLSKKTLVEEQRAKPIIDQKCAIKIMASMTQGALEKDNIELKQLGLENGDMVEIMHARADFYEACVQDSDVFGVGFGEENDFPVPRRSFPERAQRPLRKEPDNDDSELIVEIETIYVNSPNWDQEDQSMRKWKGKDTARKDCYFSIQDADFWQLVRQKELHVQGFDKLKVQRAYNNTAGKPKDRKVLKVLEYNDEKLGEPLSRESLISLIGLHGNGFTFDTQPNLFRDK